MDEAFQPFDGILEGMVAVPQPSSWTTRPACARTSTGCEIESPVELDVVRDADGVLRIGSTPPLYYVEHVVAPSYHRLSLHGRADGATPMAADNTAWQLEEFVDSLVVELDKTRETLAVKAINKPLSYTVKEVALDLNIFPSYDGDQVRFVTAQPGQQGASKVTIQLGSITDQQVRATTKVPAAKDDVKIDEIEVDPRPRRSAAQARRELRRGPQADREEERGSQEGRRQRDRLPQAGEPDPEVAAEPEPAARQRRQPLA